MVETQYATGESETNIAASSPPPYPWHPPGPSGSTRHHTVVPSIRGASVQHFIDAKMSAIGDA